MRALAVAAAAVLAAATPAGALSAAVADCGDPVADRLFKQIVETQYREYLWDQMSVLADSVELLIEVTNHRESSYDDRSNVRVCRADVSVEVNRGDMQGDPATVRLYELLIFPDLQMARTSVEYTLAWTSEGRLYLEFTGH